MWVIGFFLSFPWWKIKHISQIPALNFVFQDLQWVTIRGVVLYFPCFCSNVVSGMGGDNEDDGSVVIIDKY